ncbi:hypothetical protein GCM10027586_01760 [Kineococcus gypseus]|uniref:hypothetical protein n=1 Tax=Kineococcus gypseus TaxID=1637102 RepID=UPI003D7F077B
MPVDYLRRTNATACKTSEGLTTSWTEWALLVADVPSRTVRPLPGCPDEVRTGALSPDGSTVALLCTPSRPGEDGEWTSDVTLVLVPVGGGPAREVWRTPDAGWSAETAVQWSADAHLMAVTWLEPPGPPHGDDEVCTAVLRADGHELGREMTVRLEPRYGPVVDGQAFAAFSEHDRPVSLPFVRSLSPGYWFAGHTDVARGPQDERLLLREADRLLVARDEDGWHDVAVLPEQVRMDSVRVAPAAGTFTRG